MAVGTARSTNDMDDARQSPRVRWPAAGRYVFEDRIEHRCRSIDISSSGVSLLAPTRGQIGQRVICYLDHFGRMEGQIVRLFEGGFAMSLTAPAKKREKLAHQIAWHADRAPPPAEATRAGDRIVPTKARVVLRLPDDRRVAVQIINLSCSGAALTCPAPLAIGDAVFLGERAAHVIRVAHKLVGVAFDHAIPDAEMTVDIVL